MPGWACPGLLHDPAAPAHQSKAVLEGERAGGHKGRVLAQTVTGYERRPLSDGACVQRCREAGQGSNQDSGLGVNGLLQLLLRALEAEMAQFELQDGLRFLVHLPGRGGFPVELGSHAYLLRSLAGEHEGQGSFQGLVVKLP